MPRSYTIDQLKDLTQKAIDLSREVSSSGQEVVICTTDAPYTDLKVWFSTTPMIGSGEKLITEKDDKVPPVFVPKGTKFDMVKRELVPEFPDLEELKIVKVLTPSGFDKAQPPSNMFDSSKVSRFSAKGIDVPILILDLGAVQQIAQLAISGYKGDERKYRLSLEASLNNTVYTPLEEIETQGTTQDLEYFNVVGGGVPNIEMRFLKIIGRGHTRNTDVPGADGSQKLYDWNSYTGLKVLGHKLEDPQPDGPEPPSGVDRDGIIKMQPDLEGGQSWFLSALNDPDHDAELEVDGDGKDTQVLEDPIAGKYFKAKPHVGGLASGGTQLTLRLNVRCVKSQGNQKVTKDYHAKIKKQGYMISPEDIRDMEMTSITRLNDIVKATEGMSEKWGGIHTGKKDPRASTLGAIVRFDGGKHKALLEKELFHPKYEYYDVETLIQGVTMENCEGQWIGRKVLRINRPDDTVLVMLFLNLKPFNADGSINNQGWAKYWEGRDTDGITATWGHCQQTWRIDETKSVDFKYLSVRSIAPNF